MTTIKWTQMPYYGTGPNAGNAIMAWCKSVGSASYIDNEGQPIAPSGGRGRWVDDPDGPSVNGQPSQRFVPDMDDPNNSIYCAGTMYGRSGFDIWVPTAECRAIIAAQKANPAPIPLAVVSPPPPPPPPPPSRMPWFMAWLARFRR